MRLSSLKIWQSLTTTTPCRIFLKPPQHPYSIWIHAASGPIFKLFPPKWISGTLIWGKTTLKVSDNLEGQVLSKFTHLRRAQDTVWAYPPTASLCQGCNTPGVSHSALRECGQWSDSADTGFCLHLQASPMVRKDKGCTKGESDFEIWGFWSFNYKAQGSGILSQEKQKTKPGARRVLLNCFSRRCRGARREAEWMRVEATEMRGGTQDPMAPLQVIQSFIRWGHFHRPPSTVHFHVAVTCSLDVRTQFLRRFEDKKKILRKFHSPSAVSFSSSPPTQMLITSPPLFWLVGFLMFTDVLSL